MNRAGRRALKDSLTVPGGRAVGVLVVLLTACPPGRLPAQEWRVGAWASYEGVTDARDWTTLGGQLTARSRRGDAVWIAAEQLGRFGTRDVAVRAGAALHPAPRWWLTAEAATAAEPKFVPKNAWEADVTALVARGASAGVGYRRQNYVLGAVDVVIPHVALDLGRVTWEARVFVSRNPSERTDVAALLRATLPLGTRAAAWLGAGTGRESYAVGAPPAQEVRSLETITGIAGVRYNAGAAVTLRLDATVVRSRTDLSRRGVAVGMERRF